MYCDKRAKKVSDKTGNKIGNSKTQIKIVNIQNIVTTGKEIAKFELMMLGYGKQVGPGNRLTENSHMYYWRVKEGIRAKEGMKIIVRKKFE